MAKGSIRMKDRKKFTIYESVDRGRALVHKHSTEAIKKEEEAGSPTDGGQSMTDLANRLGRPIVVNTFISILRRLNPALIFQLSTGDPTKYGIYVDNWKLDLTTNRPVKDIQPRFITGMESGINLGGQIGAGVMPEFSYIETVDIIAPDGDSIKKKKKFKGEIRGWRTVLAALHLEGLLTEAQIEKEFKISEGRDSANWKKRVHPGIKVTS